MIAVEEIEKGLIKEVLKRTGYGHLGMACGNIPYVVPVHYVYDEPHIYIYTTEGKKTEIISDNPEVCLQVEDVKSQKDWVSVIAAGKAVRVTNKAERARALEIILDSNPTLTPALSVRWMDNWIRENNEVIFRIMPRVLTGRATIEYTGFIEGFSAPEKKRQSKNFLLSKKLERLEI